MYIHFHNSDPFKITKYTTSNSVLVNVAGIIFHNPPSWEWLWLKLCIKITGRKLIFHLLASNICCGWYLCSFYCFFNSGNLFNQVAWGSKAWRRKAWESKSCDNLHSWRSYSNNWHESSKHTFALVHFQRYWSRVLV